MISIYRILYFILKYVSLGFSPFLGPKYKIWRQLRDQGIVPLGVNKKCFWFHASSGEIEYVKSIILELRNQKPQCQIVVSYSSPSAEQLFSNIKSAVDLFFPLPWDQPEAIKSLFRELDPAILIFSRTDFWPELIEQAHQFKVPIVVVSFYAELTTLKRWLYQGLFKKFKYISCVDGRQADALKLILPKNSQIQADGDTRFDQVFWRLSQPSKVILQTQKPIFICGSTWNEDEVKLWPVFGELIKSGYQIILSPHEVSADHIQRLHKDLVSKNFTVQLLSEAAFPQLHFLTDFLLVDQIGYLADLYRYGRIAFVGGSFKEKVHSVMEPLCCGLPVIVGPYYKNNPEANKYVQFTDPVLIYAVENSSELLKAIDSIQTQGVELQLKIKKIALENKNNTQKILKTILDIVLERANF